MKKATWRYEVVISERPEALEKNSHYVQVLRRLATLEESRFDLLISLLERPPRLPFRLLQETERLTTDY